MTPGGAVVWLGMARRVAEYAAFYGDIDYPMESLMDFLEAKKARTALPLDPRAALIFVSYLRMKVRKLETMAGEMDADYESKE